MGEEVEKLKAHARDDRATAQIQRSHRPHDNRASATADAYDKRAGDLEQAAATLEGVGRENAELRAADRDHLAATRGMEKRLFDQICELKSDLQDCHRALDNFGIPTRDDLNNPDGAPLLSVCGRIMFATERMVAAEARAAISSPAEEREPVSKADEFEPLSNAQEFANSTPDGPITDAQGIAWFERTFGVPLGDVPGRLDVERVRALAVVKEEESSASPEWRPTHTHADGGEYRFVRHAEGRADAHEPWSAGVIYEGADGRHWWTGNDRWFDRFGSLPTPAEARTGQPEGEA